MNDFTQQHQNSAVHASVVRIADASLVFAPRTVPDATPTGRQIAIASEQGDPTELIVLHWLSNGLVDEVGPDESVDIQVDARFIVVRSDRTYRFELDGLRNEWPAPLITGATLKRLAHASHKLEIYQEREGQADAELEDEDHVRLDVEGVERFYTRKAKVLTIYVNNNAVSIEKGRYTGAEIKQIAITQGIQIQADFLLSLIKDGGGEDVIGDNDPIKIKDGMRFSAVADDDASME